MNDDNIILTAGKNQRVLTPFEIVMDEIKALKEQVKTLTARIEKLEKEAKA